MLRILLKELNERQKHLEEQEQTLEIQAQIHENNVVAVRVQQMLMEQLSEKHRIKTTEEEYGTPVTIDELVGHYKTHFLSPEQFKDLLLELEKQLKNQSV